MLAITISIKIVFDSIFPPFSAFLYTINPIKVNYLVSSGLTLVIAYLFTQVYNIWLSKDEEHIGDAIKEVGNEMEFLIRECFYDKEMILVTLNTGKFYVGYSESLPIPSVTKYIKLMPMLSGYRDERQMLVFTTHYTKIYADFSISQSIPDLEELNLKVILNFESIVSVSTFKLELYDMFNPKQPVEDETNKTLINSDELIEQKRMKNYKSRFRSFLPQ